MKYFVSFSYQNDDGPITQRDAVFECVGEIDIEKLRYSLMEKNNASTLSIHNYIPINKPDSGLTHEQVIDTYQNCYRLASQKKVVLLRSKGAFIIETLVSTETFTDITEAYEYLEDL